MKDLIENNEIFINFFPIPSPKEMILISRKFKEKKGEHFLKYLQTQLKEEEFFVIKELIYNFCRPSENFAIKLKNYTKGVEVDMENINHILILRNKMQYVKFKLLQNYK